MEGDSRKKKKKTAVLKFNWFDRLFLLTESTLMAATDLAVQLKLEKQTQNEFVFLSDLVQDSSVGLT